MEEQDHHHVELGIDRVREAGIEDHSFGVTEGEGALGVNAKVKIMVGAGFAAVPAGGDQEQVKACPPTKGRLSRDLPNLKTRMLARAK